MHKIAVFLLGILFLNVTAQLTYTSTPFENTVAIIKVNLLGRDAPREQKLVARQTTNSTTSTVPSNTTAPNPADLCPQDDGKIFYSPDGHPYIIKYGYFQTKNQTTIQGSYQPNVLSCAAHCAAYNSEANNTSTWAGANYYPAGATEVPPVTCFLRSYVSKKHFPRRDDLFVRFPESHMVVGGYTVSLTLSLPVRHVNQTASSFIVIYANIETLNR